MELTSARKTTQRARFVGLSDVLAGNYNHDMHKTDGSFPFASNFRQDVIKWQCLAKSTIESWCRGWADNSAIAEENAHTLLRAICGQGPGVELREAKDDLDEIVEKLAALRLEPPEDEHHNEPMLTMNNTASSL